MGVFALVGAFVLVLPQIMRYVWLCLGLNSRKEKAVSAEIRILRW